MSDRTSPTMVVCRLDAFTGLEAYPAPEATPEQIAGIRLINKRLAVEQKPLLGKKVKITICEDV